MSTSSVLNSLNYIDEVITESHMDVGNALLDSYMKQAETAIIGKQCGIIQEGFEYKEGENILKTIFLYIPRLIVALIQELKRRWDIYATNKRLEKLVKNLEKQKELIEKLNLDLSALNNDAVTTEHVAFKDGVYYIYTTIKDFDAAKRFYESIIDVFGKYKEAAKDFSAAEQFNDSFEAFNKVMFAGSINLTDILSKDRNTYDNLEEFLTKYREMKTARLHALDTSKKTMKDIQELYTKINDVTIGAGGSNFAERIMDDVRKINEKLSKVDLELNNETTKIIKDLGTVNAAVEKFVDDAKIERKAELAKELNEKTDQYQKDEAEKNKLEDELNEKKENSPLDQFIPGGIE